MYKLGKGVAQNDKEAVKWCRLAADQGHAPAQCSLGLSCERGKGVAQNGKEAVKWHRLAAGQGHAEAQVIIGMLESKLVGTTKVCITCKPAKPVSAFTSSQLKKKGDRRCTECVDFST